MRINAETKAFLELVDAGERGKITIVSYDYVKSEIEQIIDPLKRKDIRGFERALSKKNVTRSRKLIELAKDFSCECRIDPLDALHIASACMAKANYLLTCDDQVIGKADCVERFAKSKGYKLKVSNPLKLKEREIK
jgi:predicted nucleic acid-binding protein